MRVSYGPQANRLTRLVFDTLRGAGFGSRVEEALVALAGTERQLLATIDEAKRLLKLGEYDKAVSIVFADPDNPSFLNADGQRYLDAYAGATSEQRLELREGFHLALRLITPGGWYQAKRPLNLIVALDLLFHVVVLPRYCFRVAHDYILSKGAKLVLRHSSGSPEITHELVEGTKHLVGQFWELFDKCVSGWDLYSLLSADPAQHSSSRSLAAQELVAARSIYMMNQMRDAA